MADRTLVKTYLLDAALNGGATDAEKIAWLESQRAALSIEVTSGDWEVNSSSFEGGSASGRRSLTAKDRLAAIIQCIERLNGDETSGGALIIPQISGIHN